MADMITDTVVEEAKKNGLFNMVGGMIQSAGNAFTNIAMQKEAYQKNIDLWNMQNTYNNPVNQMQRLKDAGLNPNLVYGNGAVANNSAGIAHVSAIDSPDLAGEIGKYANIRNMDSQSATIALQNENLKRDALIKDKSAENLDFQNSSLQEDIYSKKLNNRRLALELEGITGAKEKGKLFQPNINDPYYVRFVSDIGNSVYQGVTNPTSPADTIIKNARDMKKKVDDITDQFDIKYRW